MIRRMAVVMMVVTLTAGGALAQKKGAIKPVVTVVPAAVKAGEKVEVKVTLNLGSGLHINSNQPEDEFAIATDLKMSDAAGLVIEAPRYPAGKKHTYSYAPKGLTVYEGKVEIAVPVQVKKDTKPGQYPLKGRLTFQPCDADVCYPPEKADVAATVQVK